MKKWLFVGVLTVFLYLGIASDLSAYWDLGSCSISKSDKLLDRDLLGESDPKLSLGVLETNKPNKIFGGTLIFNLKEGLAWKPSEKLTFDVDICNFLNNNEEEVIGDIRLGMEAWVKKNVAFRCGIYHINNSELRAYTAGFGWKIKSWKLDYGFVYWEKDLEHMLSLGYEY